MHSRLDELNILGRKYAVLHEDLDESLCGYCDANSGDIHLSTSLSPWMYRDTVLHETMHAILRQQGYPYGSTEEKYVGALATGLISVLDNNPSLWEALKC